MTQITWKSRLEGDHVAELLIPANPGYVLLKCTVWPEDECQMSKMDVLMWQIVSFSLDAYSSDEISVLPVTIAGVFKDESNPHTSYALLCPDGHISVNYNGYDPEDPQELTIEEWFEQAKEHIFKNRKYYLAHGDNEYGEAYYCRVCERMHGGQHFIDWTTSHPGFEQTSRQLYEEKLKNFEEVKSPLRKNYGTEDNIHTFSEEIS